MRVTGKMYFSGTYSRNLEYIVNGYSAKPYPNLSYFSRNTDDNYGFSQDIPVITEPTYIGNNNIAEHENTYNHQEYSTAYLQDHSFTPQIFLATPRQKTKFIDDADEIKNIANEIFELMTDKNLPENISINILPLQEFKQIHSRFGTWSHGILGFSINGNNKKIFVRENSLDELILVIGHEIGHVLTETLPNKHDEEAKAFAFTVEWAETIKKHNIANLGLSIKDELDFQPARNGLHDASFGFVDFMVKKGMNAMDVHNALTRRYFSVFNKVY